jgi:K+-transporting ATPase ATPase A chain
MGNNNGSAFAGLTASGPFYAISGGLLMLAARFVPLLAALALAGSLGRAGTRSRRRPERCTPTRRCSSCC